MATNLLTSLQDLEQLIIELYCDAVRTVAFEELKKAIMVEVAKAHPQEWAQEVFGNLSIQKVFYNHDERSVFFDIVAMDLDEYQMIKAEVLDEGNQHNGALWTEPGRTALTPELTGTRTHNEYCRGVPAIWVHNSNEGALKEREFTYKRKDGSTVKKTYKVHVGAFYPLFVKTYLPAEFNREGVHILENALQLIQGNAVVAKCDDYVREGIYKRTGWKL